MLPHRLQEFPFPLAYPARLVEVADGTADRMDKAAHFVELTASFLGVLGLAWCRANRIAPGGVSQWESKLDPAGITLATWNAAVRAATKAMAATPHDPVARLVRLAASGAISGVENYNPTRNKYAHGGKPRLRPDQEGAAENFDLAVSAILDHLNPLNQLRIGIIRASQNSRGSYLIKLDAMIGYAEPFPIQRLRSSRPFNEGSVIAYHNDALDHSVDLSPYCIWRNCADCNRDELFYLHQRKKGRSFYFSFSTGHELIVSGDVIEEVAKPAVALGLEGLGSARAAASSGWRAAWTDLAPRRHRIAARLVDSVVTIGIATLAWSVCALTGLPTRDDVSAFFLLLLLYEPATALNGGTLGKRLVRIDSISIWDGRALKRGDVFRRAIVVDLQLLFPLLLIRNLAWILWDPARQCLHDRYSSSIVIAARTRPGRKF